MNVAKWQAFSLSAAVMTGGVMLSGCGNEPDRPAQSSVVGDRWQTDARIDPSSSSAQTTPTSPAPDGGSTAAAETPDATSSAVAATSTGPAKDPEQVPETTALPGDLVRRTERQATLFMQAYQRPAAGGPAEAGWWDTVRPFLTDGAAQKLKATPSTVPFTRVTAPPTVARGQGTDLTATVRTDAGEWLVTFTQTGDERLLVSALTRKEQPAPKPSPKPSTAPPQDKKDEGKKDEGKKNNDATKSPEKK